MTPQSTPNGDDAPARGDHRPAYQAERAASPQPDPNNPAVEASAGTPNYGQFGGIGADGQQHPAAAAADLAANDRAADVGSNSGANDNPDEFSEFRDPKGVNDQAYRASRAEQPGYVAQNQDPQAVREAQATDADNDEQRAAWSKDDPRYAGGGTHNTRDEKP